MVRNQAHNLLQAEPALARHAYRSGEPQSGDHIIRVALDRLDQEFVSARGVASAQSGNPLVARGSFGWWFGTHCTTSLSFDARYTPMAPGCHASAPESWRAPGS